MSRSIPVLYYHRIGAPDGIHLSTPVELFDRQLGLLAKRGLRSIRMEQLYRHVAGVEPIDFPAFAVTFDDGFRDNLTNALPILRKYRCQASVFAVAALVRPDSEAPRESARDFNLAHLSARGGDRGDFLSWQEIREMTATGLVEVHSHSRDHNQVFTGNTLAGLYPDTDAHWGVVSAYGFPLPAGTWPVFPRGPGLLNRAWKPDFPKIKSSTQDWKAHWQEGKAGKARPVPADWLGKESADAFRKRVAADLAESRAAFAEFHPPGCDLLCWPWGAFDDQSVRMAREAGYAGALATSTGPNLPGGNPFTIPRYAVKKSDLARFALGIWLRTSPTLAGVYRLFRTWGR